MKTSDIIIGISGVCKFRNIMIDRFWVQIFDDFVGRSSFRRGCPVRKVDEVIVLWGQTSYGGGRFPCSGSGGTITLTTNSWSRLNLREVVGESIFDFRSARPGWLWVSFINHSPIGFGSVVAPPASVARRSDTCRDLVWRIVVRMVVMLPLVRVICEIEEIVIV